MSKIIEFPDAGIIESLGEELKHTSYTKNGAGDFGVATLCARLEIARLNDAEFLVITHDGSYVFDRESLAEFVHVAGILLDSEKRFYPEVDLIGCNY